MRGAVRLAALLAAGSAVLAGGILTLGLVLGVLS